MGVRKSTSVKKMVYDKGKTQEVWQIHGAQVMKRKEMGADISASPDKRNQKRGISNGKKNHRYTRVYMV